jgi:dTMP kinase
LRDWLAAEGHKTHLTQEPSRGPVGGLLRLFLEKRLTLDMDMSYVESDERLNPAMLALLFAADRLDHLASEVQPLRHKGWIVVSDRYVLSSLAYQSIDCRLDFVREINALALPPDLTILLDVPVSVCRRRMAASRRGLELFDEMKKQERVRENYLALAESWKRSKLRTEIVDGDRPIEAVHEEVKRIVGQDLGRSRQARPSRRMKD